MKKENAGRTTISITPSIYAKAKEIMRARDFSDFSGLLHQLIREEWERRRGPARIGRATLKKPLAAPSRAVPHEARPKLRASSKRSQLSGKPYDPSLKSSHENPSS